MTSSAHKQQLHLTNPYGATAAPPPTPSTQTTNSLSSPDVPADVLSRLLHRLPPTLSLPTRRSPLTTTVTASLPCISISPENPNLLTDLLSASSQHGFFQLINHSIPSQLAHSAESESIDLFKLPKEQKQLYFPRKCPLGCDCNDDDDDDENGVNDSFCLDSSYSAVSTKFPLASLGEFTREMEKVGLAVLEALSSAVGFENPAREDPTRLCSSMWIAEGSPDNTPTFHGRIYPYVAGLHYQIRFQRYNLMADSGWVSVSPQIDSILVTLGDIAQVWSNGKIKKVLRPVPIVNIEAAESDCGNYDDINPSCISMSLLVTLPVGISTVTPLLPTLIAESKEDMNQVNE